MRPAYNLHVEAGMAEELSFTLSLGTVSNSMLTRWLLKVRTKLHESCDTDQHEVLNTKNTIASSTYTPV